MTVPQKFKTMHAELKEKFKGHKLVLGYGPMDAKIVFVSERAPHERDVTDKAMTPIHEKTFNQLLKTAGINKRHIYVTNVVKYAQEQTERISPKEMRVHGAFLREELKTINPKIVVTLGDLALMGVGLRQPLENVHGRTFAMGAFQLLPTFHPESARTDARIRLLTETDFRKLKEMAAV